MDSQLDTTQMNQLLKQAIATKDYEKHIQAMFNATQAKESNNAWHLGLKPLTKDYFIAMYGGAFTIEFLKA